MQKFSIKSRHGDYRVAVGEGAWRALRQFPLSRYSSTFVITEKPLWSRWGAAFSTESGLKDAAVVFVPRGETSKSLRVLGNLGEQLSRRGADRRSLLILFGGGVIGDLGGFLASAFMRGVDCVQTPTTVLAQVDSSIGGKTAVNVGETKNLLGAFYPPRLVVSEPRVLASLTPRNFRSGLYEVVKHAILSGPEDFALLERAIGSMAPGETKALGPIICRAVKVKVDVVNRDEHEAGLRMTLNLGHTFGHAIEEATGYGRFTHGEAIGWGLIAIARLARRLNVLRLDDAERIESLVRRVGPLRGIRDLRWAQIERLLPRDKKAVGGAVRWVIPEGVGQVRVMTGLPPGEVRAAFREAQQSSH